MVRTVAFVDLAGFSALVDVHGDAAAVDAADLLVRVSSERLGGEGTLVKSIGDAVMLAFDAIQPAVTAVVLIVEALATEPRFPLPSVGLHHGTVMERGGDLFGRRVNVASRLAAVAEPAQILCTKVVADVAQRCGHAVISVGTRQLRNIAEPIQSYAIGVPGVEGAQVDPVCRMRVGEAGHVRVHAQRVWHFCSTVCADRFAAGPDQFMER